MKRSHKTNTYNETKKKSNQCPKPLITTKKIYRSDVYFYS